MQQKIPKLTKSKYCKDCLYFVPGFDYCRELKVEVRPKLYPCSHYEPRDNKKWSVEE